VEPMRLAATQEADIVLALMPMLRQLPRESAAQLLGDIMGRYHAGRDSSRFVLISAVTSLARDTGDPQARWRLEEWATAFLPLWGPHVSRTAVWRCLCGPKYVVVDNTRASPCSARLILDRICP
jgi:hypothetical protein